MVNAKFWTPCQFKTATIIRYNMHLFVEEFCGSSFSPQCCYRAIIIIHGNQSSPTSPPHRQKLSSLMINDHDDHELGSHDHQEHGHGHGHEHGCALLLGVGHGQPRAKIYGRALGHGRGRRR